MHMYQFCYIKCYIYFKTLSKGIVDNHAVSKKSGAGKKSGGETKFSNTKTFNKKTLMSPARQTTMVELSAAKPHTGKKSSFIALKIK